MDCKIWNMLTPTGLWTCLLFMLPVALATSTSNQKDSTVTVVLLFLLLIVLCIALVLAWKRLVETEGGEVYHPMELWGRTQDIVQSVKNRWMHEDEEEEEEEEEGSTAEDKEDEEDGSEHQEGEPDITAL